MINTSPKRLERAYTQIHPAMQFLIFVLLSVGFLLVATVIGGGIASAIYGLKTVMSLADPKAVFSPDTVKALWLIQLIGTTLPIFVSPVFFAYVIVREPERFLKISFKFSWLLVVLVLVLAVVSNPLIEFLSNVNQKIPVPHWLQWMSDNEKTNEKLMGAMLQMKTVWDCVLDVLTVGLLTAIAEEFMFRGVLQTILLRLTGNIHAAVWIGAFLFSAFHMEFFGLLPRMFLGVFFGYFVAWSKSIWTSVWAHFLNNGSIVVITYLFQHKLINIDPDDQHVFNYQIYAFSFIIVIALLLLYRKIAIKNSIIREEE